ncbi:hypothetical protein ACFQU7_08770 [Pseudoroseomonas wenyumeiae]
MIDKRRARAASYVMKYILKALNEHPVAALRDKNLDDDVRRAVANGMLHVAENEDRDGAAEVEADRQIEQFDRHRALASERGWRRFAFLGVHGIQRIWQRLFTLDEVPAEAPENIRRAHAAMNDRRWGDAILALGAIRGGATSRVRLDYDERMNSYGEARKAPARIIDEQTGWTLPLRSQQWAIERARETSPITVAVSCPRPAPAARPLLLGRPFARRHGAPRTVPGAPPPAQAPPAVPRIHRRPMLTMQVAEAAYGAWACGSPQP